MKQPVRLFSIGLMTAGVIMLVVFMIKQPVTSEESMATEDMIAKLENEQYHVLTEEDYIALSVDKSEQAGSDDNDKEQTENDENNAGDDDSTNEDTVEDKSSEEDESDDDQDSDEKTDESYTIEVEPGMSSRDISEVLENNDIIDDHEAFNAYLQDNDYGQLIQIGTSEVNASMSFQELAETLSTF